MSRPAYPTAPNQMNAIEPTENIIQEQQSLRSKLYKKSHKGNLRQLLNQALELLQNEETTL